MLLIMIFSLCFSITKKNYIVLIVYGRKIYFMIGKNILIKFLNYGVMVKVKGWVSLPGHIYLYITYLIDNYLRLYPEEKILSLRVVRRHFNTWNIILLHDLKNVISCFSFPIGKTRKSIVKKHPVYMLHISKLTNI